MEKRWILALVTAVVLISGLVAPAPAPAEVPKPTGHLVIAFGDLGGENWLAPLRPTTENYIAMSMYDSLLTRSNETGDIVAGQGGLAKSHEVSADVKTFTFELVKGVLFHDGWGELTAKDVKFSFELAMADESTNDAAGIFRDHIETIEIVDPYKIIFHLKKPGWDFADHLTSSFQYGPIASKKYVEKVGREKAGRHPIGSGSFKFKEHVFGDHITVEAVENHWYKTPRVKNITWRKVPEPATRLAMLRAGEAHLTQIVYDQVKEAKKAGLKVKPMLGVTLLTVQFLGMYQKPTYDPKDTPAWAQGNWWEIDSPAHKVRKALSLAIDRQTIVDKMLYGYGSVEGATASPFFPNTMGHAPDKTVIPYDPKLALKLLREAGYEDPKDLKVVVDLTPHGARPYGKPVMEAIAGMWEEIGVTIKTRMATDYPSFMGETVDRAAFSAWCWPAPMFYRGFALLSMLGGEGSRLNYYGEAPELTRLLKEGAAATTMKMAVANSNAVNDYLYKHEISTSVAYAANLYATAPNLVWPNKPGQAGVIMHNFQYMYFEK